MVNVLGFDVGGANTKAVFISQQKGKTLKVRTAAQYFPIWKNPQKLVQVLEDLKQQLRIKKLDGLAVTMTAELSDAYQTKREGVNQILSCVNSIFSPVPIYVLNTAAELIPLHDAFEKPLEVAAANWAATGWLVSLQLTDCVIVDVGSTSTSIIPVQNGKVSACGKTDLEKLLCGELVYTGSLRTNVAAIVQSIPIRGSISGVSSELFALSADVHLILGNITESSYTTETADGRKKTVHDALARLARVVCADTEILGKEELLQIAKYIYEQQIDLIAKSLAQVYNRIKIHNSAKLPVVVTGLGRDFIAREAAKKIGADEIIDLSDLLQAGAAYATPAFGVSLMLANKLENT